MIRVIPAPAISAGASSRARGPRRAYPGPERCAQVARLASAIGDTAVASGSIARALATLVAAAGAADPSAVADEHVFLFDRGPRRAGR